MDDSPMVDGLPVHRHRPYGGYGAEYEDDDVFEADAGAANKYPNTSAEATRFAHYQHQIDLRVRKEFDETGYRGYYPSAGVVGTTPPGESANTEDILHKVKAELSASLRLVYHVISLSTLYQRSSLTPQSSSQRPWQTL